jgi:Prealbumin-like fold domain
MHRKLKRGVVAITTAALLTGILGTAGADAVLPNSTFEGNDGNLVVNTPGNTDWINAPHRSIGTDLPTGTGDNSFGQGAKEDNVNTTVVSGSIPNSKADLASFYVANEQAANGDIFLYLGWARQSQSGTTNFDFEVNQKTQPNLTTPGPKTLNRTVGDLLINYLFQGQGTPQVNFRTWTGSAWSAPTDATAFSEAAINTTPVANIANQTPDPLPAQQFGELAINLTAAGVFPPGVCEAFGSAYVKSRSSTSFTSEIKDFIAPVGINVANCSTLIVKKVTVPSPDPLDTAFAFSETGPNGFSDSFSLKNGEQDLNTPLNAGTYTASETVPANYVLTSAVCDDGSPVTAIDLGPGETVTCTFTNTLKRGAIKVTKTRKHAADGPGDHPQSGVDFTVNGVTHATDANGVACFDGLLFGDYTVHETVPAGYHGEADKTVTVDNSATCADNPYGGETVSFHNTPLTNLSVSVDSQIPGGTSSTIDCGATASAGPGDDITASATDLEPGTYNCTIVIDP